MEILGRFVGPLLQGWNFGASALLIAYSLFVLLMASFAAILGILANWKIFRKAGVPGWKSIIPIYNLYTRYKIAGREKLFYITLIFLLGATVLLSCAFVLFVSAGTFAGIGEPIGFNGTKILVSMLMFYAGMLFTLIASILSYVAEYSLCQRFGKGLGFFLGMIFLSLIFSLILAFDNSHYQPADSVPTSFTDSPDV